MIEFYSETDFSLDQKEKFLNWISNIIKSENYIEGEIAFIFCDDAYLLSLNQNFLGHDMYTDIISFDNCIGKVINGEIYISVDRVRENAEELDEGFMRELCRVMIHGIFHFCGFNDKTDKEKFAIRNKENEALLLLN